jgi:hypothetical protein
MRDCGTYASFIPAHPAVDVKSLHAKIGELTLENDLYERSSVKWRYIVQPPWPLWGVGDPIVSGVWMT